MSNLLCATHVTATVDNQQKFVHHLSLESRGPQAAGEGGRAGGRMAGREGEGQSDLEGTVGGGLEALAQEANQLALLMSLHPRTQHRAAHCQLHLCNLHLLHPPPLN